MLLDQQTLLETLPDLSNIIQPVIIHLVAYERSASAPVLSQSSSTRSNNSSSSITGAPPPTRSRPQRSTASRQPSLTPVQEAADGGVAEGERGGVAPPANDGRAPYHQQQVSLAHTYMIDVYLASYPGREWEGKKAAWYLLHAHASTFPRYLP